MEELDEGEVKNTMMKYISDLLDKGEHLDRELERMIAEGRNSNPIVNHLLFNAACRWDIKSVLVMKSWVGRQVERY